MKRSYQITLLELKKAKISIKIDKVTEDCNQFAGDYMKEITREMIKIYKLKEFDFMGYKLIKRDATYHHLVKKENGGKETIENGAVLMPNSHQYLHLIEYKEYDIYYAVNEIMKICNKKGFVEIDDLKIISQLLKMFEEEHIKDENSKGRRLIRTKFLDRLY